MSYRFDEKYSAEGTSTSPSASEKIERLRSSLKYSATPSPNSSRSAREVP